VAIPEATLPSIGPPMPRVRDNEVDHVFQRVGEGLNELYRAVRTLSERAMPDEATPGDIVAGQLQSPITITASPTPGLPTTDEAVIWLDFDGRLWIKNDAGVVRPLDAEGGGGGGAGHDRQTYTFGRSGFNATQNLFSTGQVAPGSSQGYLVPRNGSVTGVTFAIFGGVIIGAGTVTFTTYRGASGTLTNTVSVPGGGAVNTVVTYAEGLFPVVVGDTLSVNCTFGTLNGTISCNAVVEVTTP